MRKLGDMIRARRRALGWTQAALAAAAGTSRAHVAAVETGRSRPSLEVFAALVGVLGLSAEAAVVAAGWRRVA